MRHQTYIMFARFLILLLKYLSSLPNWKSLGRPVLCVLLLCVLTVAQSVAGSNVVYKPPILGQVSWKQTLR